MNIFIICTVRKASNKYLSKLEQYARGLKKAGHNVHLPHLHTDQKGTSLEICTANTTAILKADEVHIFYSDKSQGTHFDMGAAFALGKPIVIVENDKIPEKGKSFSKMLIEWAERTKGVATPEEDAGEEELGNVNEVDVEEDVTEEE